jgi:hypothetical protein
MGYASKAIVLFEDALRIWKSLHGEYSAEVADVLYSFASLYEQTAQYPQVVS